ncbi:amidase signature domain-containing protein [Scheffersomyces amazonensis]|uniref:amidase signature domain-containing protein n=1 Tax=Scheffersomyces amazonensis TaxID=1078765 RepID=UPI00315D2398
MSKLDYTTLLKSDPLEGYEDPEKFKQWIPKIEKYRENLAKSILPEYSVELPKPIDELIEEQFNPLKYLYDEKLLTEKELAITDSSATDLVAKIAKGEYTSTEVLKAYAKRATIAHQFTNCALEIFIDEGLKRAEFLDEYYKKNGKTIGPLHGLPISLKEHMNYRGKITHAGYVGHLDNVAKDHGLTSQILEDLGAVFYVRTNQPQTLMHLDSNNNIIGLSKNPHNLLLSSGGSSSGEGSIVGFGGSALGVGSDIGGSIRGPAAFSGCIGLRPTSKRVSLSGGVSAGSGQESVPAVIGPFARSVEDIDLWMKHYINDGKPWVNDASTLPLLWRDVPKPAAKDLTVGVIYDDGFVKPTPPIQRALKEVVKKLEAAGVKVVEFKPPKIELAIQTIHKMYNCDGNYMQKKHLSASGEPLVKLTKWNLNYGEGSKDLTVAENRQLNIIRDDLKNEYTKYLNDNKIDFFISPTYNNVAPQSEGVYNWSYTALWNILDFPTLVVQTGIYQDPAVDKWDDGQKNYEYRNQTEQLEHEIYDPEKFKGAPVGIQISGRRYFDEDVVAAGKTIVEILGTDLFKQYQ